MFRSCIVKGCRSNQVDRFPFPTDYPTVNTAWIKSLEKHQDIPRDYESYFVCPLHFVGRDFLKCVGDQLQLKTEAVPSVYTDFSFQHVSASQFVFKEELSDIEDLSSDFSKDTGDDSSEYEIFINKSNCAYVVHKKEIQNSSSSLEEVLETAEGAGSDYEPAIDNNLRCLQWELLKKDEQLKESQETLQSMLNMINNQSETISVLEAELEKLKAGDYIETTSSGKKDNFPKREPRVTEIKELEDTDLQVFCISLFYFSPSVYAYMRSIIPSLPAKQNIADWVKNGLAANIFPAGLLNSENFDFNEI